MPYRQNQYISNHFSALGIYLKILDDEIMCSRFWQVLKEEIFNLLFRKRRTRRICFKKPFTNHQFALPNFKINFHTRKMIENVWILKILAMTHRVLHACVSCCYFKNQLLLLFLWKIGHSFSAWTDELFSHFACTGHPHFAQYSSSISP